jgi:hypothetical protein
MGRGDQMVSVLSTPLRARGSLSRRPPAPSPLPSPKRLRAGRRRRGRELFGKFQISLARIFSWYDLKRATHYFQRGGSVEGLKKTGVALPAGKPLFLFFLMNRPKTERHRLVKSLLTSLCLREALPLFGRRPIGPLARLPARKSHPARREGKEGWGEIFQCLCQFNSETVNQLVITSFLSWL